MNDTIKEKRAKGRPKNFDREAVLAKALSVFCEHGYQGTSMAQLSKKMGMNPPSIYNAFTDKENLFIEVLEHYHAPYREFVRDVFSKDTPIKDSVLKIFKASEAQHAHDQALGCLIANSGTAAPDENNPIGGKLKSLHDLNETMLFEGLKRAQERGEINKNADILKITRYINGLLQGAAVTARGQHSASAVKDILDQGYQGFLKIVQ